MQPTASGASGRRAQRASRRAQQASLPGSTTPLPGVPLPNDALRGWQVRWLGLVAIAAALLSLIAPVSWTQISSDSLSSAGAVTARRSESEDRSSGSIQATSPRMSVWHAGPARGGDGRPVTLELDGRVLFLPRDAPTLRDALARAGVRLAPDDRVLLGVTPLPLDQPLDQALGQVARLAAGSPARRASGRGGPRLAPPVAHADSADTSTEEALRLMVARAVPVEIIDGGLRIPVQTTARTVGAVLAEAGVQIDRADHVLPPPEAPAVAGLRILISRAPSLLLIHDGQERVVRTRASSVAELLAAEGIVLGPLDRVEPALDASVQALTRVRVVRGWEVVEELLEQRPFGESWQPDPSLPQGEVREVRAGRNGTVRLVVRRRFEDGQEVESSVVSETLIEPPRDRVLAFGIRPPEGQAQPEGLPQLGRVRAVLTMLATAYDPGPRSTGKSPGSPGYGVTASGLPAGYGVVAVDPRVIPLGTRLYIPGYGFAIAGDTGGAIVGQRIDVGFATAEEALNFGRRMVDVYILE